MGFKGKFIKYIHKSGANKPGAMVSSYPTWSFSLTNTSWFGSTKVKAYITDYYQRHSREYPFEAKSGKTYNFNIGTIDWDWCQGDVFILFDEHGKEIDHWDFFLKEYAPGECPECHGTKKCGSCHGDPIKLNKDLYASDWYHECKRCSGTGVCQTCYIPYHRDALGQDIYVPPQAPKTGKSISVLQQEIEKKNNQLTKLKGDLWQLQMQGKANSIQYKMLSNRVAQCEKELDVLNQQLSAKMQR